MERAASYESHTGYMQTRQLTAAILDAAIEGFEAQKRRIDEQIAQVRQLQNGHQPVAVTTSEPQKRTRRKDERRRSKAHGRGAEQAVGGSEERGGNYPRLRPCPNANWVPQVEPRLSRRLKKRWAAKKAGLVVVKKATAKKAAPRKAAAKKAAA
jgi:hypothetical protein